MIGEFKEYTQEELNHLHKVDLMILKDVVKVLDKHNIPYTRRAASRFNITDYDYFDEIYVMDESNLSIISRFTDDPDNKIKLLNGYIEDPWYTDNYDKVFDQIEEGINKIISKDIM